jgi:AcrR family transcriptional regulator
MPVRHPTQPRAIKTFQTILDAAGDILAEQGFEALNTNAVAQRANVNISTLYGYFTDKYALVEGLMDRFMQAQLVAVQAELDANPNPRERLGTMLRVLLELMVREPWLAPTQAVLASSPRLKALREANNQQLMALLRTRVSGNPRMPNVDSPRGQAAMRLLIEVFSSGLAVAVKSRAEDRDYVLEELQVLLNSYLDTLA